MEKIYGWADNLSSTHNNAWVPEWRGSHKEMIVYGREEFNNVFSYAYLGYMPGTSEFVDELTVTNHLQAVQPLYVNSVTENIVIDEEGRAWRVYGDQLKNLNW